MLVPVHEDGDSDRDDRDERGDLIGTQPVGRAVGPGSHCHGNGSRLPQPQAAKDHERDRRQPDVVAKVGHEQRPRRHRQSLPDQALLHDRAEDVQRRKIARRRAVDDHQPDQTAVDRAALRQPHRERGQQRHPGRSERTGHRRQRGDDEHRPRNEGAACAAEAHGAIHHTPDGAVIGGDREQIRDAREDKEQVDREPRRHLARAFAGHERADQKGRGERQRPEIDRARRANRKHDRQDDATDDMDQGRLVSHSIVETPEGATSICIRSSPQITRPSNVWRIS